MSSRASYWGQVADRLGPGVPPSWRHYSDAVNARLVSQWLPGDTGRCLKTDLFDEAFTGGFLPPAAGRTFGVDVSRAIAGRARERRPDLLPVATDVRQLPFRDRTFDTVISTSTLDHFEDESQIPRSLRELHRVLTPSGRLLVTLDNPHHPIVALRSRGAGLWQRLGLIPYEMGPSLSASGLRQALESVGFTVEHAGATQHVPRLLLTALGRQAHVALIHAAMRLEGLDRLPTRYLTGQFVCALAQRPG